MKDSSTIVKRAVLAAFFFSIGLATLLINVRSPLAYLAGVGDAYVVVDRPLFVLGKMLGSELDKRLETTEEGGKILLGVQGWRDKLKAQLGSIYNLAGWNCRIYAAIGPEGEPVVAVNPGLLAMFGSSFFKRAKFVKSEIKGNAVYQKEGIAIAGLNGFWIIGNPQGVGAVLGGSDEKKLESRRDRLGRLEKFMRKNSDVNVVLLPEAITRYTSRFFGDKNSQLLEDWGAVSNWDGVVLNINEGRKKTVIRSNFAVRNSPLLYILAYTVPGGEFSQWLSPTTDSAARISLPQPKSLWVEAGRQYKTRPGPREILERARMELERELSIDIEELAGHLSKELEFVTFKYKGKDRTVLIAGVDSGARNYFKKLEEKIPGQWESTFAVYEIRYLKRLAAYTFLNDRIIIAANPEVLGFYLEDRKKRKEVPDKLADLADDYSGEPLIMAGALLQESSPATSEEDMSENNLWYGLGVKSDENGIAATMAITGKAGHGAGPPFGVRMLLWSFGLAKLFIYLLVVLSFSALLFRLAQLRRMKMQLTAGGTQVI